jgi:P2 family phage contractile tail tube protein
MTTQHPRILKKFNAFVNGRGQAGKIDELELPEISVKTEDHRAGGMDSEAEIDMGLEKLQAKLTISDPDPEILRLVGLSGSNSASLTFRGSFVRDSDNARVAVVAEMTGRLKKGSFGTWKAGEKAAHAYEFTANYYRLTIGGVEVYEIDVENIIRRIGGVDQLAGQRADIGLA